MENNPFKDYFDQWVEMLNEWSDEQIRIWLIGGLKYKTFHPLPINVRDYPSDELISFYKKIVRIKKFEGEKIFERIFRQINLLIEKFDYRIFNVSDETQEELDFFVNLLDLVEEFRLIEVFDALLHKIISDIYKEKYSSDGIEIHQMLLRTVFSFPPHRKEEIIDICSKQILEKKYSTLCYRKLWEIDARNGIIYLPVLINSYIKSNKSIPLFEAFEFFYEKNKQNLSEFINEQFNSIKFIGKFEGEQLDTLLKIFSKFGFRCYQEPLEELEAVTGGSIERDKWIKNPNITRKLIAENFRNGTKVHEESLT